LLWLANAAVVLLVIQSVLGAVTVKLDLPPQVVMAHLGTAMLVLATLLITATLASGEARSAAFGQERLGPEYGGPASAAVQPSGLGSFYLLSLWTTIATFLLLMSGSLVTGSGAASACSDWPLCHGLAIPAQGLAAIHFGHRIVALVVGLLIVRTVFEAVRRKGVNRLAARTGQLIALFLALQVLVGALQVWLRFPPLLVAGHIALAESVWGGLVVLTVLAYRDRLAMGLPSDRGRALGAEERLTAVAPATPEAPVVASWRSTLADYVALTKPEIISLLLVTTVCTMFIASRSMPSLWLILWTTLGGALAAGGANALNCYVDQDIDQDMTRTRRRPIPAGRMEPQRVLIFGLTLGILSFMVMLLGVNMLAAVLSLLGLLFYVFVYTLWLKRSTPHNIVIGGAAGAVPPLVGWAAATGRVDVAAWWLFAIIFFWTPPHFWALALLIKRDYERAGVPMLPVVSSESHTRWQIFLYSLLLLPLTAMLYAVGALGLLYLVLALGLTGIFVWYAARLLKHATLGWARRTYRYSLLYLALLFGSMVLDHAVGSLV